MPPRRKTLKKRKHKPIGIEAIVQPGVGALYIRGSWMKKLNEIGKRKRRQIKKSHGKEK
jgi:hypothetical protein